MLGLRPLLPPHYNPLGVRFMSKNSDVRVERDSLGPVRVPAQAYYGPETARAVDNYPISGIRPLPEFLKATILVKKAAARRISH